MRQRNKGGITLIVGSYRKLRKFLLDAKRRVQMSNNHNAYSLDTSKDGEWCCSIDEAFLGYVRLGVKCFCLLACDNSWSFSS